MVNLLLIRARTETRSGARQSASSGNVSVNTAELEHNTVWIHAGKSPFSCIKCDIRKCFSRASLSGTLGGTEEAHVGAPRHVWKCFDPVAFVL